MTYEECMNLVEAYEASVKLADGLGGFTPTTDHISYLRGEAKNIRDYLGEFIGSLLNESPIGDGRRCDE